MGKKEKKRIREDSSGDSDDSRSRKKSEKRHKKEKKEKAELKEAKRLLKKSGRQATSSKAKLWHDEPRLPSDAEIEEISDDAYFQKNAEFSEWLSNERDIVFGDLRTEQARQLFSIFVKDWNSRKLPSSLYKGLTRSANRTRHNWGLKGSSSAHLGIGMEPALEDRH